MEQAFPQKLQKEPIPPTLDLGLLTLRTVGKHISVVLRQPVRGTVLEPVWETNTHV